jgi:streptogramin lyase
MTRARLRPRASIVCALVIVAAFAAAWPGSGVAALGMQQQFSLTPGSTPSAITLGPDGNMWFSEETLATVGSITPAGIIKVFPTPTTGGLGGIATGPDGNLWFTAPRDNKIIRMTTAGVVTSFPLPTASAGLAGIATGADGNLWFTEGNAGAIGRITTTGSITAFTLPTSTGFPHGINLGPDGNMWFVEVKASKIGRITPAGVITEFTIPTAMSNPRVIARGADGNVWFTEFSGNKIARATPTGQITEFPVPTPSAGPVGITAGPDGSMWVTEQTAARIGRIGATGAIGEFPLGSSTAAPDKIALGRDGNLWFTEHNAGRIGSITPGALVNSAPKNTILPAIGATPVVGQVLTVTQGSWSGFPFPTVADQWQRCDTAGANCISVPGAITTSHLVGSADAGATLRVVVTATSSAGTAHVTSAATPTVTVTPGPLTGLLDDFNRPDNTGPPSPTWSRLPFAPSGTTANLFVTSQQLAASTATAADYWNAQAFGPDSEMWATVATKPAADLVPVALGLRIQNPATPTASGYLGSFINRATGADQYRITARIGGVDASTLASVTGPELNPGDQLLFRAIGTSLQLWRGSAGTWTQILTANDPRITNPGNIAVLARDSSLRLDNVGGGTLP